MNGVCVCVFQEKAVAQRLQLRLFCDRGHRCLSHSDPSVRQQVGGREGCSDVYRFLLAFLTSCHCCVSGVSGYLWCPDRSFLPAARVGSRLLWPTAVHSQSQTAEGAVDLRMPARLCWTRLWGPVQWWDPDWCSCSLLFLDLGVNVFFFWLLCFDVWASRCWMTCLENLTPSSWKIFFFFPEILDVWARIKSRCYFRIFLNHIF